MLTIGGRTFSQEILDRIGEQVRSQPDISRRQLSLRVCEWMNWHNPAGRAQEMSCRKAAGDIAPARADRFAHDRAALCFPGSQCPGGVSTAGAGCVHAGRIGRSRIDPRYLQGIVQTLAGPARYAPLLGQRAAVRGATALPGSKPPLWLARGLELQRVCPARGVSRRVDRMDARGTKSQPRPGGEQQPFSDRPHGAGEVPGLPGVGARASALGR